MTPISFGLTLLGLVTLFWPFATLFFKRQVLDAQWLIMLALTLVALTFFLLGSFFNTFLSGEYLIQLLFFVIILVTPPVIYFALSVLTRPQPSVRSIRLFLLPSLFTVALMVFSVSIDGADSYRLWLSRAAEGAPGAFTSDGWCYNLVVFVNFYLFWTVFAFECIFIIFNGVRQFFHFKRINSEYYTSDRFHSLHLKGIYIAANAGLFVVLVSQITNPFDAQHLHLFVLTYALPLGIITFYIGRTAYRLNNSAESMPVRSLARRDSAALARQVVDYVEKQQAYLNPDLSVFLLAEQLHISEDAVIDAIHHSQGIPFADYIDSLRIEHAFALIPDDTVATDEQISCIAHQCGFLSSDAFLQAYRKVTHHPFGK